MNYFVHVIVKFLLQIGLKVWVVLGNLSLESINPSIEFNVKSMCVFVIELVEVFISLYHMIM